MNTLDIPQLKSFNILLIGDSCVDEYKIGLIERISPEAPVPIIKIIETRTVPGMADNVRTNLEKLGLQVEFITQKEKIVKTRFIDSKSGQHMLRVDLENSVRKWNQQLPANRHHFNAVVISDYNKGFLTYDDIEFLIQSFDIPLFIDTKKTDLAKFSHSRVFVKINETEYKQTTSLPKNLIVTLGPNGAMLKNKNGSQMFTTEPVEVTDVCGCGDTFLSALAAKFLSTNQIEDSIIFANSAAAIAVQHRGNYAPSLSEITNARH